MNIKKILVAALLICLNSYVCAQTDTSTYFVNGKVLSKVEVFADMVGGQSAWKKFLKKNLDYDTPVFNGANRGVYTVRVRFVVNKDGSLSDFVAQTRHGYGMEEELIRVLKRSPKWSPAIQNGQPVACYRTQTVTFEVEEF